MVLEDLRGDVLRRAGAPLSKLKTQGVKRKMLSQSALTLRHQLLKNLKAKIQSLSRPTASISSSKGYLTSMALEVVGFVDTDYVGCRETQRSTTDNVFKVGGGVVS